MVEEYSEIGEEWVTSKKKKKGIIVTILIIVIVIFSLYFISTIDSHPASPEALVLEYAERVNEGSVTRAFELTTVQFTDKFDEYVAAGDWMRSVQLTYNNLEARFASNMNNTEIEQMNVHVNQTEALCNVTIEDYCLVNFHSLAHWSTGEIEESDRQVGCLKIDSKWYLHIPTY